MANLPPKFEPTPDGQLYCFLNKERPCGADCMAFEAAPVGEDYRDKQWGNCLLLVNAHRAGKHLVVLASIGADLLKRTKNAAADAARTNQPSPPVPK
jgi:hypothetical protein